MKVSNWTTRVLQTPADNPLVVGSTSLAPGSLSRWNWTPTKACRASALRSSVAR